MKRRSFTMKKIAVILTALMLLLNIGAFATDATAPDEVQDTFAATDSVEDEESGSPDSSVAESEPKTTVFTEYGIEVTITSTKEEYGPGENPQFSLSVRNTNDYSIRNLTAKANLPHGLSYVGATRAFISIPDMQAGHSQSVDFQLKKTSAGGGGGGGSQSTDGIDSDILVYIFFGIAVLILIGAIIFAVLFRKNNDKTKILSLFLCLGLALQGVPISADAQVDSGSFNVVHTMKYLSVEYGINIIVTFGDAPASDSSGNAQGWQDAQIIDFSSSVNDILVNESVNAKFSAVMLSSERATGQQLKLYENDRVLGVLKDDGTNGDEVAQDGIFTASVTLSSNTAKNEEYYASYGELRSEPVEICYYEEIEDDSFDVFQSILDEINKMDDHNDVISYLESSEYVTSCFYDEEADNVTFTTSFGIVGVWSKSDNGMKKDGVITDLDIELLTNIAEDLANSPYNVTNKNVAVLSPYRGTDFKYDDFLTLAKKTANTIGGTVKEYKDGNVTLDVMSNLDEYGIVLIDSHGDLLRNSNGEYDQYIHIGQDFKLFTHGFSADFHSGRITVGADGRVAVNADFFKNRYQKDSFDNTLFFLGSCYSMYDESISDILIDYGAGAVFGYTDAVTVDYCNDTLKVCMETSLLSGKKTAGQSHQAALDSCGNTDPNVSNCRFVYDGNKNYSYVAQYGVIKGSIVSNDTSADIPWSRVQMIGDNGQTYDFLQEGNVFERKVEAGTYTVIVSAYGYLSRTLANVVIVNGQTTYIEETLLLDTDVQSEGIVTVKGKVINALNGTAVSGATIRFMPCHGGATGDSYVTDSNGSVIVLTTDENGSFSTTALIKGYYTAEVCADGYVTEYSNILATVQETENEITITPVLSETGDYRIILTWNQTPSDLDSHVEGMWSSNDYFHLYYGYSNVMRDGNFVANLDLDDRTGYGPETVTLTVDPEARYVYYVHNFSAEIPLYSSGAQVKVYRGNTLLQTYNVPVERVSGTVWSVFTIENGEIVTINQITN